MFVLSNSVRWERRILGDRNLEFDSKVISFTFIGRQNTDISKVTAEDIIVGIICIWMVFEGQGLASLSLGESVDPREDGPERYPNCHRNAEVGKRRRSQQKRWRENSQHGRWKAGEIWFYGNQKKKVF